MQLALEGRLRVYGLVFPCLWTDAGENLRVSVEDALNISKYMISVYHCKI